MGSFRDARGRDRTDETGGLGRPGGAHVEPSQWMARARRQRGNSARPGGIGNFPRRYYPDRVRRVSLSLAAASPEVRFRLRRAAKHPCFVRRPLDHRSPDARKPRRRIARQAAPGSGEAPGRVRWFGADLRAVMRCWHNDPCFGRPPDSPRGRPGAVKSRLSEAPHNPRQAVANWHDFVWMRGLARASLRQPGIAPPNAGNP